MNAALKLRWLLLCLAGVLVVAVGTWLLVVPPAGETGLLQADPADREQVVRGARVYAANCASCHGEALQGQANWRTRRADGTLPAPPHDATGHTWHHDDATLFGITKVGPARFAGVEYRSDMPAYGDVLDDAEIWSVLAYIKSTWPQEIRARQAQIGRQTQGQGR